VKPAGRASLRRTAAAVVVAVALLAGLASCGDSGDEADPSPSGTPTSEPSTATSEPSTPTSEPSTSTVAPEVPSEPTAGTTPSPPAASGTLRSALVPGAQLPPLNLENAWRTGATGRTEPSPPAWVCQRVGLLGNGAVTSWTRSYLSAGTSTASQVVGEFADERSAIRAFGSLQGNARDCADELADRGRQPVRPPSPLTALDVPEGEAGWGVVFSGPVRGDPDAAHIDAVVVVRVGERLSVVSMHSIGQDYNYPAGGTPPELAGPVVAARLAAG
jgi:hypothetical protein